MTANEPITRAQVLTLITRYRPHQQDPSEATLTAWQTCLSECSFVECEAALLALGPSAARTATPTQIGAGVHAARARTGPALPTQLVDREHRNAVERKRFAAAGLRGIARVYEAMGWQHDPAVLRARKLPCPFCETRAGAVCSPLSRRRDGRFERRDPKTFLHPSRLSAAIDADRARAQSGAQQ